MYVGPPLELPPGGAADAAFSERFKRGLRKFLRDTVGGCMCACFVRVCVCVFCACV